MEQREGESNGLSICERSHLLSIFVVSGQRCVYGDSWLEHLGHPLVRQGNRCAWNTSADFGMQCQRMSTQRLFWLEQLYRKAVYGISLQKTFIISIEYLFYLLLLGVPSRVLSIILVRLMTTLPPSIECNNSIPKYCPTKDSV
jgi:hypothetical protein